MNPFNPTLFEYLKQAQTDNLKTSTYLKEYADLKVRVSFGMGAPARVPWIAFITNDMHVSNGFYPVYLYYKDKSKLILSYGISETSEFDTTWPVDVIGSAQTITEYFNEKVPRYGDSLVFKAYSVEKNGDKLQIKDDETGEVIPQEQIENDLRIIIEKYKQGFDIVEHTQVTSDVGIGLFYMEKQLEDFLIQNWDKTDLGKELDLIVEEGVLVSQQYRTDIGPIDILTRDRKNGNYVVVELKKNQTSDDTVGQLARYMGWVKEKLVDNDVRGIIIAGGFDKRLNYAVKMFPQIQIYTYLIDFKLIEQKKLDQGEKV
ncbi:MAG: GTPase subunit of restriction endonuclease-like protein [candidate division WS6 bacterium GW2011_GWF1_35_23]|uniref:GTPase subunit of restriction endonuclease-like protein n=1 Tax=candidate division WS6 bacterium GW2011_GWF1_35_23 TaxID=1619097 RepID=A0A0G0EQT9_9BACT|nr:MAG: GTPase subunit of restriction endonuclease-like protein [candidate division WS6 bacterium GW2011_GWF1_35_23]